MILTKRSWIELLASVAKTSELSSELAAETAFEMASIYIEFQFLIVGSTDT